MKFKPLGVTVARTTFIVSILAVCFFQAACSAKEAKDTPKESKKGDNTPAEPPLAPSASEEKANMEERKPKARPDAAPETAPADGGAAEMFAGFPPETRVDRLSRADALRLCNLDRTIRERKADRHHAAGLGCRLAAATFARSREGCRGFYADCMARQVSRPRSEDPCRKLDPGACRITVAEFAACRRAEQRMVRELLEKLDCDYQGPRLTAPPPTPECDRPRQDCPALFQYPTRSPHPSRSGGKTR